MSIKKSIQNKLRKAFDDNFEVPKDKLSKERAISAAGLAAGTTGGAYAGHKIGDRLSHKIKNPVGKLAVHGASTIAGGLGGALTASAASLARRRSKYKKDESVYEAIEAILQGAPVSDIVSALVENE